MSGYPQALAVAAVVWAGALADVVLRIVWLPVWALALAVGAVRDLARP